MALVLSSEARMLRDTAHDFFKERAPVTALRKLRDTNDPDGFSRGLWREMAELGWTGFLVPEDHGGTEFGVLGLAQVMEAAGRTLAASPLVSTALIGASLLAMAGSDNQKAEHLPPLVAGERLFALALEEGSRHQPCVCGSRATGGTRQGAVGYRSERAKSVRSGRPCRGFSVCRGADLRRTRRPRRHHAVSGPRRCARCHAPTHDHDR